MASESHSTCKHISSEIQFDFLARFVVKVDDRMGTYSIYQQNGLYRAILYWPNMISHAHAQWLHLRPGSLNSTTFIIIHHILAVVVPRRTVGIRNVHDWRAVWPPRKCRHQHNITNARNVLML